MPKEHKLSMYKLVSVAPRNTMPAVKISKNTWKWIWAELNTYYQLIFADKNTSIFVIIFIVDIIWILSNRFWSEKTQLKLKTCKSSL